MKVGMRRLSVSQSGSLWQRKLLTQCTLRSVPTRNARFGVPSVAVEESDPFEEMSSSLNIRNENPVDYDVLVLGGGIVGLSTTRELLRRFPGLKVAVVEKESSIAAHQTSHNSGVIHCGIYYKPGSFKARLCAVGNREMYQYCEEHGIEARRCGKLIVAVTEDEIPRLKKLFETGQANGVPGLSYLSAKEEILKYEPLCEGGIAAIHCESTGIVRFKEVAECMAKEITDTLGGSILLNHSVEGFEQNQDSVTVHFGNDDSYSSSSLSAPQSLTARQVISACGSQSDRVSDAALKAHRASLVRNPHLSSPMTVLLYNHLIHPESSDNQTHSILATTPNVNFPIRGSYLHLRDPHLARQFRGNIYPVPDPSVPVLGVHFTPTMDGNVILGPTAQLCGGREAYTWRDLSFRDLWDVLTFRGFWNQVLSYRLAKFGILQIYRTAVISAQVRQLQKYVPSLRRDQVERAWSGVRGQAVNEDGTFVNDFVFEAGPIYGLAQERSTFLHVKNAPSPACTSCLALSREIVNQADKVFQLGEQETRLKLSK